MTILISVLAYFMIGFVVASIIRIDEEERKGVRVLGFIIVLFLWPLYVFLSAISYWLRVLDK